MDTLLNILLFPGQNRRPRSSRAPRASCKCRAAPCWAGLMSHRVDMPTAGQFHPWGGCGAGNTPNPVCGGGDSNVGCGDSNVLHLQGWGLEQVASLDPEVTQEHQPQGFPWLSPPELCFGGLFGLAGCSWHKRAGWHSWEAWLGWRKRRSWSSWCCWPCWVPGECCWGSCSHPLRRTGIEGFAAAAPLGSSLKQEGKEKGGCCRGLEELEHGFCSRGDVWGVRTSQILLGSCKSLGVWAQPLC